MQATRAPRATSHAPLVRVLDTAPATPSRGRAHAQAVTPRSIALWHAPHLELRTVFAQVTAHAIKEAADPEHALVCSDTLLQIVLKRAQVASRRLARSTALATATKLAHATARPSLASGVALNARHATPIGTAQPATARARSGTTLSAPVMAAAPSTSHAIALTVRLTDTGKRHCARNARRTTGGVIASISAPVVLATLVARTESATTESPALDSARALPTQPRATGRGRDATSVSVTTTESHAHWPALQQPMGLATEKARVTTAPRAMELAFAYVTASTDTGVGRLVTNVSTASTAPTANHLVPVATDLAQLAMATETATTDLLATAPALVSQASGCPTAAQAAWKAPRACFATTTAFASTGRRETEPAAATLAREPAIGVVPPATTVFPGFGEYPASNRVPSVSGD